MCLKLRSFVLLGLFVTFIFDPWVLNAEIPSDFLKYGKLIYKTTNDIFQKRMANDWEGIYSYQHPDFKIKISLKEFIFYDGKVAFDYRSKPTAHVSGGYLLPSQKYINNNSQKKDILGFPAPRKFRMTTNPLVTVENFIIKSVAISTDKKYAKTDTLLKGNMRLDPGVVRAIIFTKFNYHYIDFWEKVDGKWVITVLKDTRNISGNTNFYFIPNDSGSWKNKDFVEMTSDQLIQTKP